MKKQIHLYQVILLCAIVGMTGLIGGGWLTFPAQAQEVKQQIVIGDKEEIPTVAVRCYASDVRPVDLYTEWSYLYDYAWEDITVRRQSPTLLKITARKFYTHEAAARADAEAITSINLGSNVVTCG